MKATVEEIIQDKTGWWVKLYAPDGYLAYQFLKLPIDNSDDYEIGQEVEITIKSVEVTV